MKNADAKLVVCYDSIDVELCVDVAGVNVLDVSPVSDTIKIGGGAPGKPYSVISPRVSCCLVIK